MVHDNRHGPLPKIQTSASWASFYNILRGTKGKLSLFLTFCSHESMFSWNLLGAGDSFCCKNTKFLELINYWQFFCHAWLVFILSRIPVRTIFLWSYFTALWLLFHPEYPLKTNIPFECLVCLLKHAESFFKMVPKAMPLSAVYFLWAPLTKVVWVTDCLSA